MIERKNLGPLYGAKGHMWPAIGLAFQEAEKLEGVEL